MTRTYKTGFNPAKLSKGDRAILEDKTIMSDVAAFMINADTDDITNYRYRLFRRQDLKRYAKTYRDKIKQQNEERFGGPHKSYNYWSKEEIEYIMTSTDTDTQMAEKLNRSVYSIQKKKQREERKQRADKRNRTKKTNE